MGLVNPEVGSDCSPYFMQDMHYFGSIREGIARQHLPNVFGKRK